MRLALATEADNEKLLSFFNKTILPGSVALNFQRVYNFFNYYKSQSKDYVTYVLLNDKGDIETLASLIFRESWLNGQKEVIGYATDLRVTTSRKAIQTWSQHYLPVLEEERKKRNCKYIFSAVAASQRAAYNAFIRPRNIRPHRPRYYLFRRFDLVSLHGLWPLHEAPLKTVVVRPAQNPDKDNLAQYIALRSRERPLHYYDEPIDFLQAMELWRDFYIENFLIAENRQGDILGCVAPWSSEKLQKIIVHRYSDRAQNFKDLTSLLKIFGICHPLPPKGGALPVRYLTHLYSNNSDIFYTLLYHAYKNSQPNDVLVYPHFEDDVKTLPPRSFIFAQQKYGLYSILSPQENMPDFLKPQFMTPPPEFEPAFI